MEYNKIKTDRIEKPPKVREGEIRWCRIGVNVGCEILGKGDHFRRPVLILKKFSGQVFLGAPLTTKEHAGNWYYNLLHENENRCIILNQARLLDSRRLEDKLFEISENELTKIKRAYCNLILS